MFNIILKFILFLQFVECIKRSLNTNSEAATFIQAAVPQILEKTSDDFFVKTIDILRKDAEMCYECLKDISCFTCLQKPQGSLFLMVYKICKKKKNYS